ncbi:MAG: mechanosensitive ion channel protein MscS [Bacteroidetes bacterium RIFCSPLOWO2_12_FULL_31_6]|nr:MAG: mechanosensitive ion channel protein MscS [Bacteroidetes bacterium RIFCSPLOWO2_12_FULL_31_6]
MNLTYLTNWDNYYGKIIDLILYYGPKLVGAILVWIIGSLLIKALVKAFDRLLTKREIDASLKPFLKGVVSILLKITLAISVLGMLGIEMTSFIAILGSAGLAIGLALSGTLQNFAGGIIILIFKPFKFGDFIEAQGHAGIVSEIQIFNTILKTVDNKTIIIPNGGLSTSSMINYSAEDKRRVDWKFSISYGDKTEEAKEILLKLMKEDVRILNTPEEPFVALSELADNSVNFAVRAWVNTPNYWAVFFDMNEKVYSTFSKEGLRIPYPQMDVHLHNN